MELAYYLCIVCTSVVYLSILFTLNNLFRLYTGRQSLKKLSLIHI